MTSWIITKLNLLGAGIIPNIRARRPRSSLPLGSRQHQLCSKFFLHFFLVYSFIFAWLLLSAVLGASGAKSRDVTRSTACFRRGRIWLRPSRLVFTSTFSRLESRDKYQEVFIYCLKRRFHAPKTNDFDYSLSIIIWRF
jgi:hypothetical protein